MSLREKILTALRQAQGGRLHIDAITEAVAERTDTVEGVLRELRNEHLIRKCRKGHWALK